MGVSEEPGLTGRVGIATRRNIGATQVEGVPLVSNWKNTVRDQSVHEERRLYAQVRGLQRSFISKRGRRANPGPIAQPETSRFGRTTSHLPETVRRLDLFHGHR